MFTKTCIALLSIYLTSVSGAIHQVLVGGDTLAFSPNFVVSFVTTFWLSFADREDRKLQTETTSSLSLGLRITQVKRSQPFIAFKLNDVPVTQSSFETPCSPLAGGLDSGFRPSSGPPFPSWSVRVGDAVRLIGSFRFSIPDRSM